MRIVWLVNGIIKMIADNETTLLYGDISWISSTLDVIKNIEEVEIFIVFPQGECEDTIEGKCGSIKYFGFYQNEKNPGKINSKVRSEFFRILSQVRPDVIHIWGTEYAHSLDMLSLNEYNDKMVIHLQGVISAIAEFYYAGLPIWVRYRYTLRDFLRKNNMRNERLNFVKRGKLEIELLHRAKYVMGRTDWDKAHCLKINPNIQYYKCNESMRATFFEKKWFPKNRDERLIFMSQWNYPIKGIHYFLNALLLLVKKFPKIKVRIAGSMIAVSCKDKLRENSYTKYIRKFIEKYSLSEYIEFIGHQDVIGMQREYLNADVYVLPSVIENSPNSLAEAMCVGTPSVVADVGGISSMVEHGKDAFIYQHNDPVMLAFYIERLFQEKDLAYNMSIIAREKAEALYHAEGNVENLLDIYRTICMLNN